MRSTGAAKVEVVDMADVGIGPPMGPCIDIGPPIIMGGVAASAPVTVTVKRSTLT
jgi:hypothetical protein